MKHAKFGDKTIVELNDLEIEIISAALNNRMVYLGKLMDEKAWAAKQWEICLDLQVEWFGLRK